jgi:hypothetical protein
VAGMLGWGQSRILDAHVVESFPSSRTLGLESVYYILVGCGPSLRWRSGALTFLWRPQAEAMQGTGISELTKARYDA